MIDDIKKELAEKYKKEDKYVSCYTCKNWGNNMGGGIRGGMSRCMRTKNIKRTHSFFVCDAYEPYIPTVSSEIDIKATLDNLLLEEE